MIDAETNYRRMTTERLLDAVGTDPEKWAEAMTQCSRLAYVGSQSGVDVGLLDPFETGATNAESDNDRIIWIGAWFRMAMNAARKSVLAVVVLLLPTVALAQQALTYADRSGTITTGGTAQVAMPAWSGRHGCVIQNQSTGSLWVSETATAVAGPPSILIPAGQQFLCMSPASGQAYSIIGATNLQAFAAREW